MRAARLYRWGDVRVEELAVPQIGAQEALVRIAACGVCGSDALSWYVDRKAPAVLGHEPVGTIVDVGAEVAHFHVGDRVFVHHHAPCLNCEECRRQLWSNCATWKATRIEPGGFAEYARVPALNLQRDTLRLPDSLDFDTASFIEPLACCIRAIKHVAQVKAEDVVLIVGLGAMGLLMAQLSRHYGARRVLGSDFRSERRTIALELGIDAVLDPAADPVSAETNERGADVVIVCPGDARAITAGLNAAAPGGRVVCFTPLPPEQPIALDQCMLYFREIALLQSYSCGPTETREALELLAAQRLNVLPLATHRAGLSGVQAALERAKSGTDGLKTIIYPAE